MNYREIIDIINDTIEVINYHPFLLLKAKIPEDIFNRIKNFRFVTINKSFDNCLLDFVNIIEKFK